MKRKEIWILLILFIKADLLRDRLLVDHQGLHPTIFIPHLLPPLSLRQKHHGTCHHISIFHQHPQVSSIRGRRVSIARSFDAGDDGITSSLGNLNLSDSKQHSRATSDDEDASSDSMSAVSGLGFHHLNTSNTGSKQTKSH